MAALAFAGGLYEQPVTFMSPTYLDATATSTYNATHTIMNVTISVSLFVYYVYL